MCEDAWGIMMVSCKRVHEWWNAKHFHISTSLVRSQVRQDRIRAHSKPTKPKMSKFNKKTATGPKGLIPSDKALLGFGHWPIYWDFSNHQAADCRPSEASLQLPWQAKQGLLDHASRTWMDIMGMVARLSIWWISNMKESVFHRGKSPYKTIISQHFCGRHTVASLDDLRGFIAEIPPKKNV